MGQSRDGGDADEERAALVDRLRDTRMSNLREVLMSDPNVIDISKTGAEIYDLGFAWQPKTHEKARIYLWRRLVLVADVLGWDQKQIDSWKEPIENNPIQYIERTLKGFETRAVGKLTGLSKNRKKMTW